MQKKNLEKNLSDSEWKKILEEEYIKEADMMEESLLSNTEDPGIEMTDEEVDASFDRLVERLKADGVYREDADDPNPRIIPLESAEEKEKGFSRHFTRHKAARVAGFVVVCTLAVFVTSMTSEANRNYFMKKVNYLTGNDTKIVIDNDETNDNTQAGEKEAKEKIEEELQVSLPEFFYYPESFAFKGYTINGSVNYACMEYEYQNSSIIAFFVGREEEKGKSHNFSLHGEKVGTVYADEDSVPISILEIEDEKDEEPSYAAQWEWNNAFYQLSGKMEKEEFIKLVENIIF